MNVFIGVLFLLAVVTGALLPGEAAYPGAYVAMSIGAIGLLGLGWRQPQALVQPVSLAIWLAIALISATLLLVYRSQADLLAPLFVLPMLTTIGLGLMGRPAKWLPDPALFAALCLLAAFVASAGGAFEAFLTGTERVGLGNNPIHYASLAAMVGGLSLVGVAWAASPWRYFFFLGPIFAVAATVLSGSRGPLAGILAMTAIGTACLLVWYWRDRILRYSILAALLMGGILVFHLISTGNDRVIRILTAMDIFRFTGGSDDIRAALYASAVHALESSPVYGLGFGQLMVPARTLFPEFAVVHHLDNLHADWANFATMAGGMGLLAWLLLLLAPFALLLDPFARTDRPTILGAILLVTGQGVLGVSNAMFGVLPQTVLYAVVLGYFFARTRRLTAPAPLQPQEAMAR